MGKLPILPQDMNHRAGQRSYPADSLLPADYMSDFSVLGLVVSSFQETARILEENNFAVTKRSAGIEVSIENVGHVQELIHTLQKNGVDCTMTDIVDQIYQG